MWRWALVSVVGCGGEVDPVGVYRVESQLMSNCVDPPTPSPMAPASLEIHAVAGGFSLSFCTDVVALECGESQLLVESNGAWTGDAAFAGVGGEVPTCALQFNEIVVTVDGDHVRVVDTLYLDQTTPQMCSVDEARARGTSMPCKSTREIDGTRR